MIESKLSSCVACYGLPRSISAKRSSVPGAQASSSSVDDSRLCKIYNEYETCNMRREGPVGRAGFESMFIDRKTCASRVGLGMFYFL
jgi:hypothetical protein